MDFLHSLRRRLVLFDGGMGAMLIAAGLEPGRAPESWLLKRPEEITTVHRAYLEAGAEVIVTATFGANRLRLASSPSGCALDPSKLNSTAVRIAREALSEEKYANRFLAGDIGPTGRFFPPIGALTQEEARASFREQAEALECAGVDLFLIETMVDLREAMEALRAVRDVSNRPVIVCLTFERKPRGFFTLFGDTPQKAVDSLLSGGADGLGANCTLGSGEMIELACLFRPLTEAPLLFQPNAGQPVIGEGLPTYRQQPAEFAEDLKALAQAGANAVGGCCGATPEFIRQAHDRLFPVPPFTQ
jgi:5-methyltetrahydrofolate--homocysteine methyltransferase